MAIELYTTTKPAVSHRAWVGAIALLALALGLAAGMTWRRSGARLSEVTAPEGWLMSFRVPREFKLADRITSRHSASYLYRFVDAQQVSPELSIWKLSDNPQSADEVCQHVLQSNGRSFIGRIFGPPPTQAREPLGSREAVEVVDPAIPMFVRATIADDGAGYAVALRLNGMPLEEAYGLFEIACHSTHFNSE